MAGQTTPGKERRDKGKRTTKRQQPRPLAPQTVQKVASQPLQAPRAEILVQLHDTIVACEELFKAHGQACPCDCCCLVSNFVGAIRVFHMLLEIT